jgi:hypothetical protein
VRRRALAGLVLAVVLAGCQVRTEVDVAVRDDGSGTVTVAVRLDADAVARVPQLERELRLDDLRAAGWTVTGPAEATDGSVTVVVTKPFSTPAEAEVVLGEVAGPLLGDVSVTRDRSFARSSYAFGASADLAGGLEAFGDERLAALLDGEPLGEDVAAIEERIGVALEDAFTFRVTARLPGGSVESWEVPLGGPPVAMAASSSTVRTGSVVLVAVAVVAALAAVAVLVAPGRRRRGRRRPRHRHTPSA